MALRVKEEWEAFFIASNIPADTASTYATTFVQGHITEDILPDLTKDTFGDLGINVIGDILAIIKQDNNNYPLLNYPKPYHQLRFQSIYQILSKLQLHNYLMFQLK